MPKTHARHRQRRDLIGVPAAQVQRAAELSNLLGRAEHHASHRDLISLQQTAGNGAVQRLLAGGVTAQREELEERLARNAARALSGKSAAVAGVGGGVAAAAMPGTAMNSASAVGSVATGHVGMDLANTGATSLAGGSMGAGLGGVGLLAGAGLLGYGLHKRSKAGSDHAMRRLGGRTARGGGWLMAGGAAATAVGGLEIAAKTGATAAGIAPAAFALMMAGGAVTAGRGLWKLGKSIGRLRSLGEVKPVTEDGQMWLARAKNRAKNKAAVAGFKTVLGGLGIAAGALLLASNPIGWAVGLGAALAGGLWALGSMRNKAKQVTSDGADRNGMTPEQTAAIAAAKRSGAAAEASARSPEEKKKAQKDTSEATAALHSNLQVGMQMRGAATGGTNVASAREAAELGRRVNENEAPFPIGTRGFEYMHPREAKPTMQDFRAIDALDVASGMNISAEELRSPSGAKLVQEKLSAADAA